MHIYMVELSITLSVELLVLYMICRIMLSNCMNKLLDWKEIG